MIENMDQGVLVVSLDQKIKFANQTALKILGVNQGNMVGKTINFRPLTFEHKFVRGHMQHVISFDDKKELIIGQLHAVQDQWLFYGFSSIARHDGFQCGAGRAAD